MRRVSGSVIQQPENEVSVQIDRNDALALALSAMQGARDDEAMTLLRALAEAEPDFAEAHYLLAAQYAQLGDMAAAEAGFRHVLRLSPQQSMARFQLGQLLALAGRPAEAIEVLAPLAHAGEGALAAYAAAISCWAAADISGAIALLRQGLSEPQQFDALRQDMMQLDGRLTAIAAGTGEGIAMEDASVHGASLYLSNYRRYN